MYDIIYLYIFTQPLVVQHIMSGKWPDIDSGESDADFILRTSTHRWDQNLKLVTAVVIKKKDA